MGAQNSVSRESSRVERAQVTGVGKSQAENRIIDRDVMVQIKAMMWASDVAEDMRKCRGQVEHYNTWRICT